MKYIQDDLPNFLDSESRESMIDETTRQIHLARQFIRFDKMIKLCRNDHTQKMLERCKADTLKLMQRQ